MNAAESDVFVYHSLNDGNLYKHEADTNESTVVMDESIFVRSSFFLFSSAFWTRKAGPKKPL